MRKRLGSIVRARRKVKGMTCKGLAQQVGVDRSYIGKIENLNLLPAYHILLKLERVLGVNLKNFYLEEKRISPDFLVRDSSGNISAIEVKATPIDKQKEFATYLYFYIIHNQKAGAQKVAYSIIRKLAPSKAGDKRLQDDLATTIRTLRKVYPTLVSQGSRHPK